MARLPDGESDSIRQGYLPWLRAGGHVAAYEHEHGYFAEHSTPGRYLDSNWALVGGTPLRHPPSRLAGIDPTARIDPERDDRRAGQDRRWRDRRCRTDHRPVCDRR